MISTNYGTPLEVFKSFVNKLDGGKGQIDHWDNIQTQMYVARLNATQAAEILKENDFIEDVSPHDGGPGEDGEISEEYRAVGSMQPDHRFFLKPTDQVDLDRHPTTTLEIMDRLDLRALGSPVPGAPWWKKMLSAPPPRPNGAFRTPFDYPEFLADDTGGIGTTIYVLDDGFDVDLPVSTSA